MGGCFLIRTIKLFRNGCTTRVFPNFSTRRLDEILGQVRGVELSYLDAMRSLGQRRCLSEKWEGTHFARPFEVFLKNPKGVPFL